MLHPMNKQNEIWLPVPGFPGYDVSNQGRVRSYRQSTSPRLLVNSLGKRGYYLANLYGRNMSVHRLVLLAFVGRCPDGMETRHLNGICTDNRLENLKWGTRKENCADKVLHKTSPIGSKHGRAKLTDEQVLRIKKMFPTNCSAIARQYNVTTRAICDIKIGATWKHLTITESAA